MKSGDTTSVTREIIHAEQKSESTPSQRLYYAAIEKDAYRRHHQLQQALYDIDINAFCPEFGSTIIQRVAAEHNHEAVTAMVEAGGCNAHVAIGYAQANDFERAIQFLSKLQFKSHFLRFFVTFTAYFIGMATGKRIAAAMDIPTRISATPLNNTAKPEDYWEVEFRKLAYDLLVQDKFYLHFRSSNNNELIAKFLEGVVKGAAKCDLPTVNQLSAKLHPTEFLSHAALSVIGTLLGYKSGDSRLNPIIDMARKYLSFLKSDGFAESGNYPLLWANFYLESDLTLEQRFEKTAYHLALFNHLDVIARLRADRIRMLPANTNWHKFNMAIISAKSERGDVVGIMQLLQGCANSSYDLAQIDFITNKMFQYGHIASVIQFIGLVTANNPRQTLNLNSISLYSMALGRSKQGPLIAQKLSELKNIWLANSLTKDKELALQNAFISGLISGCLNRADKDCGVFLSAVYYITQNLTSLNNEQESLRQHWINDFLRQLTGMAQDELLVWQRIVRELIVTPVAHRDALTELFRQNFVRTHRDPLDYITKSASAAKVFSAVPKALTYEEIPFIFDSGLNYLLLWRKGNKIYDLPKTLVFGEILSFLFNMNYRQIKVYINKLENMRVSETGLFARKQKSVVAMLVPSGLQHDEIANNKQMKI